MRSLLLLALTLAGCQKTAELTEPVVRTEIAVANQAIDHLTQRTHPAVFALLGQPTATLEEQRLVMTALALGVTDPPLFSVFLRSLPEPQREVVATASGFAITALNIPPTHKRRLGAMLAAPDRPVQSAQRMPRLEKLY